MGFPYFGFLTFSFPQKLKGSFYYNNYYYYNNNNNKLGQESNPQPLKLASHSKTKKVIIALSPFFPPLATSKR